jgi:TetR/AcrR family transcriptional repressor of nem operon
MKKSEETRQFILQKAFELIYVNGYQATSIDEIIATTNVTKGAFFYHFKNKDDMGLAVINEVMLPAMSGKEVQALKNSKDPVKDIYTFVKKLLENPLMVVTYGCPAANLSQEMAPLNHRFSAALSKLVKQWQLVMEASIRNGKKAGTIKKGVNTRQVTYFVMSGYWGIRNFGKLYNSTESYRIYLKELKHYLETLR